MARVAATGLLAVELFAPVHALADERLGWDDLRPARAAENNPFERLSAQQVECISEIALGRLMQARSRIVTAEAATRHHTLSAALAAPGLDAEELLRQRNALIEQRRAAAESPVPAVAGREARLHGHLVPASADGRTVTDFLFVPWANACSHTRQPYATAANTAASASAHRAATDRWSSAFGCAVEQPHTTQRHEDMRLNDLSSCLRNELRSLGQPLATA